ncbi:hypothetical protein ACN4EG_25100 [Alkalinema pantanalense CENA528]|uniref:hypothetical protein n=1 Tax=Alkalinema pantanalense TaxID=1620705 RepID=UPI003D6F6C0A
MRDLMKTEAADRVADELHEEVRDLQRNNIPSSFPYPPTLLLSYPYPIGILFMCCSLMLTQGKALQMEVTDLWKDANLLVGFLSRVRPPWHGSGIFKIDSDRFFFRVTNEGGFERDPERKDADPKQAVKAVFSATKKELSEERI